MGEIKASSIWLLGTINQIEKPLIRMMKEKGEKTQMTSSRNEMGDNTTVPTYIQRIIKGY
jgi:hypothetical protein